MKPKHVILIIAVCLFSACSKNDSGSGNTGGSTGGGGTDTTRTGGGGGTVTPPSYVVKTIGISRIRMALDDRDSLSMAEFIGGGNRIIVKGGGTTPMAFSNPKGYEPTVNTYGDAFPDAVYPAVNSAIDNGQQLDTTMIAIKLKGFNRSVTGYDQLNLVLCKEVRLSSIELHYTLSITYIKKKAITYKNSFYQQVLTSNVNVTDLEIAKPASQSPYIVRDVLVNSATVVSDPNDKQTMFTAGDGFWNVFKFNLSTNGAINVGGQPKIELVNADKGTFTAADYYSGTVSNAKHGTFKNIYIPEPQDTISNTFVRLSGFDASITGFNQVRLILCDDGTGSALGMASLGLYQYANPLHTLTIPLLQKMYAIGNFSCIKMVAD